MSRVRRRMTTVLGLTVLATGTLVGTNLVGAASAQPAAPGCGSTITQNTTLTQDIGPCPGDGLIITASNITLDLNGHSVTGAHGGGIQEGPGEQVGIRLARVSGVTVQNGEVRDFDSGVAIVGGSRNTLRGLNVHDNINHSALGGAINACDFGDGITVVGSDDNRIVDNRIANNGPMSGVAFVGDSDRNDLARNQIVDNNIRALTPTGEGILCGTGEDQGPMGSGRAVQNIGVRIEGPGADNNRVANNEVINNALAGIAVHGYICNPRPDDQQAPPNDGTTILNNRVSQTGAATHQDDPQAHGISVLATGPASVVCVSPNTKIIGNDSSNNFGHGIFVGGRGSHGHQISANRVHDNNLDGIHLQAPPNDTIPGVVDSRITGNDATGNAGTDGFDGSPNCGSNMWRGNQFLDVNQPCVSGPGRGR